MSVKDISKVPQHVAIIMDGNGRWAQQRHLPRNMGHVKGASGVRVLVERCAELGIECLTLFAFSTENWRRPDDEVSTLMGLFVHYLEKELRGLSDAGVRLKVIGDVARFKPELRQKIEAAQSVTENNTRITLCVAANYGGRWDVVEAIKRWQAVNPGESVADLTEAALSGHLSTAGLPDVDLLVRTGGEQRISNFLLWQCAYSELYFTQTHWPDFDAEELVKALGWYAQRTRRFGMTSEQTKEFAG
jgi:undecaprenyl diphosphate synthase